METNEPKIGYLVYYPDGNEFGFIADVFENYLGNIMARILWEDGSGSTDRFPCEYIKTFSIDTEKERLAAILKHGYGN
jgi:hypothetical protein